jgi:hypothetical protein
MTKKNEKILSDKLFGMMARMHDYVTEFNLKKVS